MAIITSGYLELLITAVTFCLLAGYHLHLIHKVHREPLATAMGLTDHVRSRWVHNIQNDHGEILAVQTLRNMLMAASFLASTAILITLGLLSVAFKPGLFSEISQTLNLAGTHNETLWMLKLLMLIILFFSAFFNFTLTIRYYNHAGFMINLLNSHDPAITPAIVAQVLNRGALHYTLGMRGYYLAVPIGLWLFGPLWMLAGSIALVLILSRLDHTV